MANGDAQRGASGITQKNTRNRRGTGEEGRASRIEQVRKPAQGAPRTERVRRPTQSEPRTERRDNARTTSREPNERNGRQRKDSDSSVRRDNARKVSELPAAAIPIAVGGCDPILTATVLAAVAFGIVMVYSASNVYAYQRWHDDLRFLVKQTWHAVVGLVAMAIAARIDYHRLRRWTYVLLGLTVLALVWTVFRGHMAGGAVRWLPLGPFRVQPAEIAKLATIAWLAHSLAKKGDSVRTFRLGILPHVLGAALLFVLCMMQPDFGSGMMIVAVVACMLLTAGARLVHLFGLVVGLAPVLYWLVTTKSYRMRRMLAFLSPEQYGGTLNYQLHQSQMSFGAGGIGGVGLGDSKQKLMFLPEAHTDFISAIVGEELGFIGFLAVVFAFLLIVYRGTLAALRATDEYGTYLAAGISMFVGAQAFTNLAVAVGLFPTKGLVLPFISYGGTSLIVNCSAMGILLNVSRPRSTAAFRAGEHLGVQPRIAGGVA